MGDRSLVSRDYQRASRLADLVTRGALEVKKASLRIPQSVSAVDLQEMRSTLSSVLRALSVALRSTEADTPTNRESSRRARALLSPDFIERIRRARGDDLTPFLESLTRAADALAKSSGDIAEPELTVLDEVAGAADAEASRVYRRMVRP